MTSLSSGLGDAGAKLTLAHGGKTYEVSYLTQAVKAGFESWVVGRALETLGRLREVFSAEEYEREKARLLDDVAGGRFGFHGEVCRAAMRTTDGNLAVVALLFGCPVEEMVRLLAERGDEVKALVELVVRESAPAAKKKTAAVTAAPPRSTRRKSSPR